MRVHTFITALLLALIACKQSSFDEAEAAWQSEVSSETMLLVDDIAEVNVVMGSAVGSGGTRPQQYDSFEALKSQANSEELIQLTDHPNGVVRCYAFWALTYLDSVDLYSIVLDHLDDTTRIRTRFGCSVFNEFVGDFFINRSSPPCYDDSQQLSLSEMEKIDSILLHEPNFLESRHDAIQRAQITEVNHPVFRKLLIEENDHYALLQLAKYQKNEDVELIMNYRNTGSKEGEGYLHTYRAIQTFPHQRFLPLLKNNLVDALDYNHFKFEWLELYRAIAIYKNEVSRIMLEAPFSKVKNSKVKGEHIEAVFEALQGNQAPVYEALLWRFWEEQSLITPLIYDYLKGKDVQRATELTKKSLSMTNDIYSKNQDIKTADSRGPKDLIRIMLADISSNDPIEGYAQLKMGILNADYNIYGIYSDRVMELGDPSLVPILFERFELETDAHVYLKIAESLIAYEDAEINQRILEIRRINDRLTYGWGGKELDELLIRHGLNK